MHQFHPLSDPRVTTICRECALANGAWAEEWMVCTVWMAKCHVCGVEKAVSDVSDWNWKQGKKPASFSIHRRD